MPIASIIFMQDDQGRAVVDALTHTEAGIEVHGVTAASIEATVDYLAQWDTGEYPDLGTTTRAGLHDHRVQVDSYLLTWNTSLGYVGLEAVLDGIDHADVTTCRGCEEPVDMCLDHTHAPDTESSDWNADYLATSLLLEASA